MKTSIQDFPPIRRFSDIEDDEFDNEDDLNGETDDDEKQIINEEKSENELKKSINKTKKSNPSIDEVQTFREAYDRQHRGSRTQSIMPTKKVHTQEPSLRSLIQKM